MSAYNPQRRAESDVYLQQELTLLSCYFNCPTTAIRESTEQEDIQQATDLVLPNNKTVAKRVRTPEQAKFAGQMIFRHAPNAVNQTEWQKVLAGYGDYYLYSIAADACTIQYWWLIDLAAIRYHSQNCWKCCAAPDYIEKSHEDGSFVIDLNRFPSWPPVILKTNYQIRTTDHIPYCNSLTYSRYYYQQSQINAH